MSRDKNHNFQTIKKTQRKQKVREKEKKTKNVILVLHMNRAANQTGRPAKTHHFITGESVCTILCVPKVNEPKAIAAASAT